MIDEAAGRRGTAISVWKRAGCSEAGSLMAAPLCERRRSVQQRSLTSQASIQWIGPRKSILPMSTPLWRRIA